MTDTMMKHAFSETMSWEGIRHAILNIAEDDRGRLIEADTCDAIIDRRTDQLTQRLQRELSVLLHGHYLGTMMGKEQLASKLRSLLGVHD